MKGWGKASSSLWVTVFFSRQVPFPLPTHADTQHLPQLAHPTGLGWAWLLQCCHHPTQRRPWLRGRLFLSDKDTAWLPPGRRHLTWVSQPRAGSQVQQGPRMAVARWVSHLHSAQVVAEGWASLLLGWAAEGRGRDPGETPAHFLGALEFCAHCRGC